MREYTRTLQHSERDVHSNSATPTNQTSKAHELVVRLRTALMHRFGPMTQNIRLLSMYISIISKIYERKAYVISYSTRNLRENEVNRSVKATQIKLNCARI
jgi:hypothetical protein